MSSSMGANKYEIPLVTADAELNFSDKPKEFDDGEYPVHFNLRMLSHSSLQTFHSCPRRFQLYRMMPRYTQDDEAGHLAFGTVVGNGVQEYLISGSLDRSIFRAFLDWKESIDEEKAGKSGKTFWHAVRAIQKFVPFRETYLSDYEVAYFDGKPACELGFDIDFGDGFHYRGKLDALLIHKRTKQFRVFECKTTGSYSVNEAMYKNSGQALGYGLVVDRIAHELGLGNEYNVLYPIYKTRDFEWEAMPFPKSDVQRALWLQSGLIDCAHIKQYVELDYFPIRGESCFSFNRQCEHFGICTLSDQRLIGDPGKVPIKRDKEEEYPFKFDIAQLIEAQVEKGS